MPLVRLFLAGSLLISAQASGAVESHTPQAYPASRYLKLSERAPFALATPTTVVTEKPPSPFNNLHVIGLARIKDPVNGDRDFVTIKSRDAQQLPFSLSGAEENKEGFSIVSVEWSDRVGKSKVVVKKGAEVGTLEFDEMTVQNPVVNPNAQRPNGVNPGIPGAPVNGIINPRNQAGRPPAIPRPNVNPQGNQPLPMNAQPQGDARRRIRVINSKP